MLTFVTAYLSVHDEITLKHKLVFHEFIKMAEAGIQLCIVVNPENKDVLLNLTTAYPNIYILDTLSLKDTWIAKQCEAVDYTLPENRNSEKDTDPFLKFQNAKHEFLEMAMEKNPFDSTHFAWIDFGIAHIFNQLKKSKKQLRLLGQCALKSRFFAIPGCWGKWDKNRHAHHLENIHWRFCGCFFMADKESMQHFCQLYRDYFPKFLKETNKLVWDVNFWAWLEYVSDWNPTWYAGDHSDSCLYVHNDFICGPLSAQSSIVYNYPSIPYYQPSSASYLYYKNKHWLNTRFLNYHLTDTGAYLYPDGTGVIKNKNLLSELILDNHHFVPANFTEMNESTVGIQEYPEHRFSRGLEDVRLYEFQGQVRFIATTIGFSKTGKARIMVGNYHVDTHSYSDCHVISPPNPDSWCEKNWIPICRDSEKELFVYKWCPMEIGEIVTLDNGEKQLNIIETHDVQEPWFHKIRGSTTFTMVKEGLLGVVHFSEECSPRHYFHMLMWLDPITLKPIRYSMPFYFQKLSVEFCIGFAVDREKKENTFWVSRMDRDSILIKASFDSFEIVTL